MRLSTIILFVSTLLLTQSVMAQTVHFHDNFESYSPGAFLCVQADSNWTTWNNGPGTAEDPYVTDSISYEGSKSVVIRGSNDAVLQLYHKTTGRYTISFYIYIPAGHITAYGLLRRFENANSDWGLSCYFRANGIASLQTGDPSVGHTFNYTYNHWHQLNHVIDLDNNHAEVYFDGLLLKEFNWNATGSSAPGPNALGALNFYAWPGDNESPTAWVDDITFGELNPLAPPLNLQADVSGDTVTLHWDSPLTSGNTGYKVYRDSTVIAGLVTSTSFLDADVYPGMYQYSVKAVYPTGLSPAEGPVTATVNGGKDRDFVVVEIGTGTWCTYCPGAAMAADDLITNGKKAAIIEYHSNDPYEIPDGLNRLSYYQVVGLPTSLFDGGNPIAFGSAVSSLYPVFIPRYEQRIEKRSLFDIQLKSEEINPGEYSVVVTTTQLYPYPNNQLKLRIAVTESKIPKTWQVIMHELNFVCRAMLPNGIGTTLDFGDSVEYHNTFILDLDSSWVKGNCTLIAYLQDDMSQEVLQCDMVPLNPPDTIAESVTTTEVFPNPASDNVTIQCPLKMKKISVYDLCGRLVFTVALDQEQARLNITGLPSGLYMIEINTEKGPETHKLLIQQM